MIAEAVTATTVGVALGAAAVMLVLALLVGLVRSRRRGSGGQQQMLALVSGVNVRMEGMGRELSEALERAQEEARRARVPGGPRASIGPRGGLPPPPRARG